MRNDFGTRPYSSRFPYGREGLKKGGSVKKKKKGWVKIADGVYQNLAKMRAEEKPKKKKKKKTRNWFKGLGSSSRGPGNK